MFSQVRQLDFLLRITQVTKVIDELTIYMIISLPFPISAFKATWEVLIGSQQFVERFPRVQKLFKLFTTRN